MKSSVPVTKANRLVNCGCTVLVSSHDEKKPNIVTIAWQSPVSHDPMMVGVAIGKPNYSHDIIMGTREFVINIPAAKIIDQVMICGKKSRRDCDKFKESGLTSLSAQTTKTPLIEECIGHIEVARCEAVDAGDHSLFFGKVTAASANEGLFKEGMWDFENPEASILFHWGGSTFTTPGPKVLL